ncbi:carbohydrate kinase family protein [Alginatibacterium sediminis]|uniref:Carbohydrate kinase family protein n=1 Tax=Alginatibacterium sediminis TaxID=2164068 RepID=A0A420E6I1_9ALTE|nr:carbohydrate kinase family protein [Alginatibacterium sediminis]RKF13691.1 carbohydrate kinase family protein [Alginatibacterium sediminis]
MYQISCLGMAVADVIVGPVESFNFSDDVTLVEHMTAKPGGDASNVAINLNRLGVTTTLFAKVGNDLWGNFLLDYYRDNEMPVTGITRSTEVSTATCIALVAQDAERVFLYQGGATDSFCLDDINLAELLKADVVHASGYYLLPGLEQGGLQQIFELAQASNKLTSLDVGWDNSEQWLSLIAPLLPFLDYFLPTENEAQQISGCSKVEQMAQFFIDAGVKNVVIKAGAKGAYAQNRNQAKWVKGQKVSHLVDTTGAGDGFVSGFWAALAREQDFFEAVATANRAGAIVVQSLGSVGAIQNYQQLQQAATVIA